MLEGKITKLEAAKIVHEDLLDKLGEPDEEEWQSALLLKDIYDCKKCVRHIAQVYVKGIILPRENSVFGTQDIVSEREKEEILLRLNDASKRKKPAKAEIPSITYISEETAAFLKAEGAVFADVSNEEIFEEIKLNPYSLSDDLSKDIVLRCERGYMSTLTANLLISHGYRNVKVIKK